jgi:hypothetical protein
VPFSMRPAPCLLLLLACARPAELPPIDPVREGGRAALAVVTVESRVDFPVRVSMLLPALRQGELVFGTVPAGASYALPPVPAGEPIVLIARAPDGAELRLGPRSFAPDQSWLWLITPDDPFIQPES